METIKEYLLKLNPYYYYAAVTLPVFYILKKLFKKQHQNSLSKKTKIGVVITGGSRGIGYEFAKEFLRLGHSVVICGKDENNLKKAVETLKNDNLFAKLCDVTNEKQVEELVQFSVEKLGNIDLWVNIFF